MSTGIGVGGNDGDLMEANWVQHRFLSPIAFLGIPFIDNSNYLPYRVSFEDNRRSCNLKKGYYQTYAGLINNRFLQLITSCV